MSNLEITDALSPNFNDRGGVTPSLVVLHYTDMESGAAALERLRDPAAQVSAHYMIEEDGRIFRLVAEDKRAWHAGESYWAGEKDINAHSIGIEIVNPGHTHGYRDFPAAQMAALTLLLHDIKTRYDISPFNVLAHSDVAPARKIDPGELFNWRALVKEGLAVWPAPGWAGDPQVLDPRALLAAYGYDPQIDLAVALTAFQRHFHPELFEQTGHTGRADPETLRRLSALVRAKLAK